MLLLSSVRMGINLGLIDDLSIATVNELFIQTQPAFLQKLRGHASWASRSGTWPAHRTCGAGSPTGGSRPDTRGCLRSPGLPGGVPAVPPRLADPADQDNAPRGLDDRARLIGSRLEGPAGTSPFFSFELDPTKVLGRLRAGDAARRFATAYREKAKRYHPDKGGEDWAFRILAQAYEMLSSARVARATHREPGSRRCGRPGRNPRHRPTLRRCAPNAERQSSPSHAGIVDHEYPARASSAVELLCVRYLWDDADYSGSRSESPMKIGS